MYTLLIVLIVTKPVTFSQPIIDGVSHDLVITAMQMQMEYRGFTDEASCRKQLDQAPHTIQMGQMLMSIDSAKCQRVDGPKT